MPTPVHYLPILTTLVAAVFAVTVFRRYREKGGTHLLWWGIGMITYGAGTITESLTTLTGWHEPVFRAWYITGALLGGAPLAQGTAYLLFSRKTANRMTVVLVSVIVIASVAVLLAPIDVARVETHRLSGRVFEAQWVRAFSPFINLYAAILLIGGAVWSAVGYARVRNAGRRVWANASIALGALLPGIGGSFTRFGHVEVLYVTELIGLLLIFLGYRLSTTARTATIHHPAAAAPLTAVPGGSR
ncbi:MAG: hypothetical protein AB7S39_23485 [Gemmatimonadales bacterium]